MEKRTKIALAGTAVLVALSGIAFAQNVDERKQMKRFFSPEKLMQRVDTNGDLSASREEVSALAQGYFAEADADKDAKLTKAEIVTAIEASEVPERMKKRSGRIADRIFRQGDVNEDGSLTMIELENRIAKFHALADWNDDNSVEVAELQRLRGSFGRGWRKEKRN
ncbi:MAG: hypothetical protein AAGA53_01590 [Pseudomonadota bacterium]